MREEKPTLGLIPKDNHNKTRAIEIVAAMERYIRANKPIPQEWLDELSDLKGAA